MQNKVIIIGNDHSNTLGVIRSLGENKIKPFVFIISDTKFVSIKHSKYIQRYWICKDEEEAILMLVNEFKNEELKPVIIPTSDKASSILDCNYNRLKRYFILHNIDNNENMINYYMDKYNQYNLAKDSGIKVAKSEILTYPFNVKEIYFDFPIIIKPVMSVDGKKEDIVISNNLEEFKRSIEMFKDNGYKRILIQELIKFDYECDMSGFCYNGEISISGYIKKDRIWPLKRGSLTFGEVKKYNHFAEEIDKIKQLLSKIKYQGLFDIEFFVKDNKVYLNEINFRNSGLTYLYGKSYICYYYYLSCVNNKFQDAPQIIDEYYIMDEQAEIHQIIDKNITLSQHFKDKKKAKIMLAYNKEDKKAGRKLLFYKIINNLKLKKFLLLFEKGLHKCKETYLLTVNQEKIKNNVFNNDYDVICIDKDNFSLFCDTKESAEEFKKSFHTNNIHGIILKKDDMIIGKGIIKEKNAGDRFVKIKNDNAYLICNIYVNPKFRGKNYQCDIVLELINRFVKSEEYKIYSIVYKYNIPSWRNFEKIGFEIKQTTQLIRMLGHSINKVSI